MTFIKTYRECRKLYFCYVKNEGFCVFETINLFWSFSYFTYSEVHKERPGIGELYFRCCQSQTFSDNSELIWVTETCCIPKFAELNLQTLIIYDPLPKCAEKCRFFSIFDICMLKNDEKVPIFADFRIFHDEKWWKMPIFDVNSYTLRCFSLVYFRFLRAVTEYRSFTDGFCSVNFSHLVHFVIWFFLLGSKTKCRWVDKIKNIKKIKY